ncbi:MFS transporter [Actinomadura algeriensis]|uniref:MFS family permease n=1 Tax=Actinomadura algeriensis TaxID=1679523 RepID=A0ABR9JKT2_9ACTN|nr:MFS transporter [Actinomadura algeriensis]MBE1530730.1 MFS family permease [Actinomadura algeriensis]
MDAGRRFGRFWAAYAASTFGTRLAFDAFALIAILALHSGPAAVSLLAAAGTAAGAAIAVPLGPWTEHRRKRPVMIAMDVVRAAALLSVPAAFAFGRLTFVHLLVVAVVVAAAEIAFRAASGAYLKWLVPPERLLAANGRLESTTWTATALGPPLGTAAIGLFGPVTTMVANAAGHLLSAGWLRAIDAREPRPVRPDARRARAGALLDGWRYILADPALRLLFLNTTLVNGLIMATSPLLAVLMLGPLGFAPWQYGLVFALPCVGGLIGSRLAPGLVARFGRHRVMRAAGTLRACWPVGLAFVGPGVPGLVLVMVVELGLILCIGVFNPVLATCRLEMTAPDRVVRTLSAWSVTAKVATAALTAVWGLLAGAVGSRAAIAAAGVFLLATPLLLPRRDRAITAPGGLPR